MVNDRVFILWHQRKNQARDYRYVYAIDPIKLYSRQKPSPIKAGNRKIYRVLLHRVIR